MPDTKKIDASKAKFKAVELETETNPWCHSTFNLTEQARLLKSDPAHAERLKEAAEGTWAELETETNPDEKIDAPKDDIRFQAMASEIGRLKIEALAQQAGAIDAWKVYELVNKNIKTSIDASGNVQLVPVDENGERLRNADGTVMSVGQYVSVLKASPDTGFYFQDGASRPKAKDGAKTPGGFDIETNPWAKDTWNLTAQGAYMRSDPVLAARMKAIAGGNTASSNPFVKGPGFNLTRQGQILRENPALGEQLRQEAIPPENPWLKSQYNLTKQVLIVRSDPTRAARLKAEAKLANGPDKPKSLIFVPPPGSLKRMGTGR